MRCTESAQRKGTRKMNSVLSKHQKHIEQVIGSHRERLIDLQIDMSAVSDIDPKLLRFLARLESEYREVLARFENLAEAMEVVQPKAP
ncbi:hypothetical protein [Rhizobium sp. BG4]|uniref:hypothetical protein n=1 Tax=Rhizobium sp. BG4 TaxID=2613770 RepID=UPI00193E7C77|nr:hypothetical protein [Rhizobium sp. BG4]QRM43980.1 hypothetical protein F2982_11280 [Rhizobium sp. BG4]